jgi:hypothetical protein
MTYEDRKILLIRKKKTIAGLAAEYESANPGKRCSREMMSQCIRSVYEYPELREFLAKKLDTTIERLFGPKRKARKAA